MWLAVGGLCPKETGNSVPLCTWVQKGLVVSFEKNTAEIKKNSNNLERFSKYYAFFRSFASFFVVYFLKLRCNFHAVPCVDVKLQLNKS